MNPSQPYAPPQGPPPQQQGYGGYVGQQGQYGYDQQQQQGFGQPQVQQQGGYYGDSGKPGGYTPPVGPDGQYVEKFAPQKPRWNDLPFAIFFIAQFLAFIAVSVISLRTLGADNAGLGDNGGTSRTLNIHAAYLLALVAGAGLVLSILLLILVRAFTRIILELTLLLSVVVSVAYAAYLWVEKFYSGAIIATIFAVLSILFYFPMRRRIPFSKALLQLLIRIANEYKSTYVLALLGTLLQTAYSVWWSFTIIAVYQKFRTGAEGCSRSGGSCGNGALIPLCIFCVFSFYYTSQMIMNVFLTTEAGIFSTWYFTGGKGAPQGAPTHVARGAFKRAMTTSFGSIAFGSLIVAILDTLRAILSVIQNAEAQSGDLAGAICACIAQCCVGCIANLVEYFNRYAYIEIAMYGKKYLAAAKDTWRLFRDRGIDALINDSLINNIWAFGALAVGFISSFFAYIYVHQTRPDYIIDSPGLYSVLVLYAFVVGFSICYSLGYSCLSAGVSTIFVGLAEDPGVLAQRDPALFAIIQREYPKVTTPV